MPWEDIGDISTGDLPEDRDWIVFCQKLAIQYLIFVCGKPPAGTSLKIRWQDHELGSYPSIGLWHEFDAPWDYINKCEKTLDVLDDSMPWDDLKNHYENSLADEDMEDDSEYVNENEGSESQESPVENSNAAVSTSDSCPHPDSPADDFPIDDFAEVGAMMLIKAIAAQSEYLSEDFYAKMKADFGDVIDRHWEEIYNRSLGRRNEWLNELRAKKTNEIVEYEYGWDLSDAEIDEIMGEESEDQRDREEIENEIPETQRSIAENEERLREAVQDVLEAQHRMAVELERIAKDEGLVLIPSEEPHESLQRSDVDALGFYSQAYRVIESKMPNMAAAEQVKSILSPRNGIKNEELEWLDIDSYLRENPHPSREEILDYIRLHSVRLEEVQLGAPDNAPPHFQDRPFHLPGGENYREFVLTMPEQIDPYEPDRIHFTTEGGGTAVVWARFDERDCGKSLHIAEIQSKRHQDGREHGYRDKDAPETRLFPNVPPAPYKNANAWSMLMFKRVLRYAAENGFERITWDTGKTQAERYGLNEAGLRGMEAFYDEVLVHKVNSFVKRWDARVVKATGENGWTINAGDKGQIPVHSVEITEKLRGTVLDDGVPLFSVLSPDE